MKKILFVLLLSLFVLTACANLFGREVKNESLANKIDRSNPSMIKEPVIVNADLPLEKLVINAGGKNYQEFEVEIASTDAQRRVGLMNRNSLPEKRGMLFVFENQGYLNFWMKNTLIALDMIFIDENNNIVHIVNGASPCLSVRDSDCPKYNSEKPAKFVLEINAGMAKKLSIGVGDKVSWL